MESIILLRQIAILEQRLAKLENSAGISSSSVDLSDVSGRLAAVEARPELSQRLSALELTVTSLNSA